MRKTFLKVALIGLLAAAMPSTFTSCKDYDDDIENLDNQVSTLKSQLESVNTTIAGLPTKADLTAAQAAAVAQAKSDLEAVKAQLEAAIANKADQSAVNAINDDLNKIKGQMETLEALGATVPGQIDALNAAITKANETAVAQGQAIAGLEAQIAELKEAGDSNTAALEALKASAATTDDVAALKQQIAELAEKIQGEGGEAASLEAVMRVMNGMITSIRLVNDWGAMNRGGRLGVYNPVPVDETPAGVPDYLNPQGKQLLFNLKKGDIHNFKDSVMVQVSPSGATLKAEQLQLINTKLDEGIKNFVTISQVKAYDGLLSRAASSNGLYVVYFQQAADYKWKEDVEEAKKNGTPTNFNKAVFANPSKDADKCANPIRFALAVNDAAINEGRYLMTPYDLTVDKGTKGNKTELTYTVNDESVNGIHNRFLYAADNSSYMYVEKSVTDPANNMKGVYAAAKPVVSFDASTAQGFAPVGDYKWSKGVAVYDGKYSDGKNTKGDNRTNMPFLHVEAGEDITIAIDGAAEIYGYYVDIDECRATESDRSEYAAWVKYADNITGLREVVSGGKDITLNITEAAKVPAGDVIGFRVWAVNYDGTLVDPDGKAFYVQVGDEAAVNTTAISATIPATLDENFDVVLPTATVAEYTKILDWTTSYTEVTATFSMENQENYPAGADAEVTVTMGAGAAMATKVVGGTPATTTIKAKDYAAMFKNIKISINNVHFEDGVTYNGQIVLTGKNASGFAQTVQIIPIQVKKTVPTTLPSYLTVAPGLSTADANINLFVNKADLTAQEATAQLNNAFQWNGKAINKANNNQEVWQNIAFLIQLTNAEAATWGTPAIKAMYTNWAWNNGNAPYFTFLGKPYQKTIGSKLYTINKTITNLDNGLVHLENGVMPTLSIVNGNVRNVRIDYQYNDLSYRNKRDDDGKFVSNICTDGPVFVNGTKTMKVQTYPHTYTMSAPAMPTLEFNKTIVLNIENIELTSSSISVVKNTPLEVVEAKGEPYGIQKAEIELTGDVATYFKAYRQNNVTVNVDPTTGVVKTAAGNTAYGLATKTDKDGKFSFVDGKTTKTINVITFKPLENMADNAPLTDLSGKLTLKYVDKFGFGDGFDEDDTVIPYTNTYDVKMAH